MVQPWFRNKFYPAPKTVCEVTLAFKFDVKDVPSDIYVMTEDENAKISVNGVILDKSTATDGYIDVCFKRIKIPGGALKVGRNELSVSFGFNDRYDVESLYLTGNFGVSQIDEIVDLPEKLTFGDFSEQGLKYYGGRVKLTAQTESGNYMIKLNKLPCAVCYFNGRPVAFMPYETEFDVTNGVLTAEVVLTRQNTFGTTINSGVREGIIPQGLPKKIELFRKRGGSGECFPY